jgi:uncharacterized protein YkwD
MSLKPIFVSILTLGILVLAGCTNDGGIQPITLTATFVPEPTEKQVEMKATATVTSIPEIIEVTDTPEPITTIEPTPKPGDGATPTEPSETESDSQPSPTPTPEEETVTSPDCLEKAAFFVDITVPDGTFFSQGESFTKTWRFRNEGTCTWTTDYAIVFNSGDNMSAPLEVPFPETVPPGEQVDLSVDMKAPTRGGQHQSNWGFSNPAGEHFGTGSSGKDLFWVLISVGFLDQNDEPQPDPSILPPQSAPLGCNTQRNQSYESQVVAFINQVRAQNGLNSLAVSSELTASALAHSIDMACNDFVDHSGSDGSHWTDRISAQGYSSSYATENIYVGFPDFGGTPDGAFEWWMNSQVHRDNILDSKVIEIGVGYVFVENSSYGGYYTINFAQP